MKSNIEYLKEIIETSGKEARVSVILNGVATKASAGEALTQLSLPNNKRKFYWVDAQLITSTSKVVAKQEPTITIEEEKIEELDSPKKKKKQIDESNES